MQININLYKFIFYTTCSVNKQHNYTHTGYKKQTHGLIYLEQSISIIIKPLDFTVLYQTSTTHV